MSESARLYRCYKQKETRAFNLLFAHSEWRVWSFRKLVRLAESELPSLGSQKNQFASLLKNATECREKIFAAFLHAPDTRKLQHRYVVVCYRKLLLGVSNTPPPKNEYSECVLDHRKSGEVTELLSPVYAGNESIEESSEHFQDYLFFDIIENCVDTILQLWRRAREDTLSMSTITTGMLSGFPSLLLLIHPQFRTASTKNCGVFCTRTICCQPSRM
jgi:hypothetical protein